jgi:hypothetical protein
MPRNDHQVRFDTMVNVWDTPTQRDVMKRIVDAWDGRYGYAYPSVSKIARELGLARRYIQVVIADLEGKEAIQRLGVDHRLGRRNRFVITLERAIARALVEAQAIDPSLTAKNMAAWPPRRAVRARFRDGCDPGITPVGDRRGCDPGIAGGVIQGSHRSPSVSPLNDLLKNAADAADPPRRPVSQRLPGLGIDTPHPMEAAKRARERRYNVAYWKIAGVARWVLEQPPAVQCALNGGAQLETEADHEHATKARCRELRLRSAEYLRYIPGACAREWYLLKHPELRRDRRDGER